MMPEETIAKAESRCYEGNSPQEIVAFQLYEDRLRMPLEIYQEAVEKVLGWLVCTLECKEPGKLITGAYEAVSGKNLQGALIRQEGI